MSGIKRIRKALDAEKAARAFAAAYCDGDMEDIAGAWKSEEPETFDSLREMVDDYFEEHGLPAHAATHEYIRGILLDVEAMASLVHWVSNYKHAWRLEDILDLEDEESVKANTILNEDVGPVPKGWQKVMQGALKHIALNKLNDN